jgi:hypothetical protein
MDIITKTAKDAARLLNAIRAQYIIVLPTGEQIIQGDLKLQVADATPQRKARTPSRHPHRFLNNHITPYLKDMKIGDVAVVPVPNTATIDEIQGSGASIAAKLWGNGSYKTMRNYTTGNLEVLRMS